MASPTMLPVGIWHGIPEGHQAGCKGDNARCPAETSHGMSCTSAYVRSTTTPDRYFKAKARDPRPAAIARTLGFRPQAPEQPTPVNPRARKPKPSPAPPVALTCTVCSTKIADDEVVFDDGMCGSCLHDAKRSGWELDPAPAVPAVVEGVITPHVADNATERARALAARLWDELERAERSMVFVLQQWGVTDDAHSAIELKMLDTLGFIDRTIDGNADSRPDLPWRNDEVLKLLGLIRTSLIDGRRDERPTDGR